MRILIVAGFGFSLVQFRGDLIKSWLAMGHEVTAVAPDNEVREELQDMGVDYLNANLARDSINPVLDFLYVISLIRLLKVIKPDLVLLYTVKPVIYGSIAALFYRRCNVFSMITGLGKVYNRNSFKGLFIKSIVSVLYRIGLKRNKHVFFQNQDDSYYFVANKLVDRSKIIMINGSGVNLDFYKVKPLITEPVVFLMIARLLHEKGFKEYVEAAKAIKLKYPTVVFKLIGWSFDNSADTISRDVVDNWRTEGVVEVYGRTNDVKLYLTGSSVFVLPSFYREGTPRSVLEAMAMGRPIITTDAPGCRETVEDGVNGFLVPVKDSKALAEAMERFIKNPALVEQMGRESRRIAEEKYDVHKVNEVINRAMGLI